MSINNIKGMMFDVDGTLIDETLKMTNKLHDTLEKLHKKGIILAINTGRPSYSLKKILQNNFDCSYLFDYYYCLNGNEIIDNKNHKELYKSSMPDDLVKKLCQYFMDDYMCIISYGENGEMYYNHDVSNKDVFDSWVKLRYTKPILHDYNLKPLNPPKLGLLFEASKLEEVYEKVNKFDDKRVSIVRSGEECMDVNLKEYSKGSAVVHFSNLTGFRNDEILTFGDSDTDVAMLKASVGCIMASESLKQQYDIKYITDSVKNDGIVNFIYKHGILSDN